MSSRERSMCMKECGPFHKTGNLLRWTLFGELPDQLEWPALSLALWLVRPEAGSDKREEKGHSVIWALGSRSRMPNRLFQTGPRRWACLLCLCHSHAGFIVQDTRHRTQDARRKTQDARNKAQAVCKHCKCHRILAPRLISTV